MCYPPLLTAAQEFSSIVAHKNCRAHMEENRKASRRRVLEAGTIEFDHGAFSCSVRNLSEIGASLDVPWTQALPNQFVLVLETAEIRRRCHVIWRKENRLGVLFGQVECHLP
jgi:hypothetical protein